MQPFWTICMLFESELNYLILIMLLFQEYIHRVGRTARGMGAEGNAVLLLRPEEQDFVPYLKESKIYLDKYESWDKFANLQPKVCQYIFSMNFLLEFALYIDIFPGLLYILPYIIHSI